MNNEIHIPPLAKPPGDGLFKAILIAMFAALATVAIFINQTSDQVKKVTEPSSSFSRP